MWILIRLLLAALGFGFRFWRRSPGKRIGKHKGWPYYLRTHKKDKFTDLVSVGMALKTPGWIRMHRESKADRFFKKIGIAGEIQTGDRAFDEQVYVTSDHPAVEALLTSSAALRAAVLRAFELGAVCVRYDGRVLWLDKLPGAAATKAHLDVLAALCKASTPLNEGRARRLADRFFWKALVIEAAVWANVGYAAGALLGNGAHPEDVHVWDSPLIALGVMVAAALFAAMLGIIALVMRGSSRGHRIVIESALLLAIGLPLTSIQLVGDSNRALDDSPSQFTKVGVASCDVRRTRRGHERYYAITYALPPASPDDPPAMELPTKIQVTRSLCEAIDRGGDELEVELGAGRWGILWYRQLWINGETWTAPS